ncbi:PadR family transcriptional regulator [Actinocatenispora thailandica]|uniref:PadR family transcriptional regulator n=1 Tax=Actinocatenispora thailandica TaxID=227318 RepID=A0A7R7I039_9ACTN|nr:PadR family transcriptional regulator [Actinocatenispora thailandica]BCJ38913.1 PadR family transcriptional regulator [Actinocatenispora thailandica]
MLDLAVLGLLHESPMHGYELRKRLTTMLGPFRAAISYGTLYPTLRRMQQAGWITEDSDPVRPAAPSSDAEPRTLRRKTGFGKRSRISYKLTAEGKERFGDLLAQVGPEAYDDAAFGVHFAFFGRTDAATRLRILEGRRRRVEERREGLRDALNRAAERLDAYSLELQRHGLEAADREVRWLEELIVHERTGQPPTVTTPHPSPGAADPNTTGPDRPAGERRPG